MADVTFTFDGDAEGVGDAIERAITQAVLGAGGQVDAGLRRVFKKLGTELGSALSQGSANRDALKLLRSFEALQSSIRAMDETSTALRGSFGRTFDANNVNAFNDQLRRLVALQEKLAQGPEVLGEAGFANINAEVRSVTSGLTAVREGFLASARASDEAARNVARDQRQVSRETIQASRAATSRYIVDQQTQAAAARDAARKRIAFVQNAARTIATIERGLSNIFRQTARVFSAAFQAAGSAVSGVAAGVGRAFSRSSSSVVNAVTNNSSAITKSYRKTFGDTTSVVRNETRNQTSIISNFARETSAALGGIGLGGLAVGGVLGLGFGKALTSGFQRAANLQDAERALTFLLRSQERAAALQAEILSIVEGTPFALDQFATATTQLLSFGIEAEKIPGLLRAVGDVAILSSRQEQTIDSLVRVFGQISAAGKLTGEDLNQLSEASVPALQILGNAFGKTTGEMREMISEGLVPAEDALRILEDGILNGTDGVNGLTNAFGGLSKELGTGLRGSLANFRTAIARLGAGVFVAFETQFTGALAAATAGVDFLGKAIKVFATAVAESFTVGLLERGLVGLTAALKTARTTLEPFFELVADGAVTLGQFSLALAAFRRLPLFLTALGAIATRVFTPMNLLIGAAVLLTGALRRIHAENPDLRDALRELGEAFTRIGRVLVPLGRDVLTAVSFAISNLVVPAVDRLAEILVRIVIPALERFTEFLEDRILPPVRRFARFVRLEIIPVIGTALARAVDFARDTLDSFVGFIRETVIPFAGENLRRGIDIGVRAFRSAYDFLANTFVPFIRSNLTEALAGLGGAIGVFALTGNLPLAGLAGLTGVAVAALNDPAIRTAIADNVKQGVETARGFLRDLVDDGVVGTIAIGALKAARKVGEVLGNILTDPRLVTLVGAVAAYAVTLAGAFTLGLVEGIIGNIPELISQIQAVLGTVISTAFKAAFDKIKGDPGLIAAVTLVLGGAAVIGAAVLQGRRIGRAFAQAAQTGITEGSATAGFGAGRGVSPFFTALFGGPKAISRSVERTFRRVERDVIRETQRLNRISQRAIGDIIRGPGGRFISPRDVAGVTKGFEEIEASIGRVALAGATFRTGISDIFTGLRNLGRGPGRGRITEGLRSIGESLRAAGPELGKAAGAVLGGAFAASFVSAAIFDIEASGIDKLQSAIGLAATAITTGAIIGGPVGVAAGVGVAAFGLISSALGENEAAAERARAKVKAYADQIRDAGKEKLPNVFDDILGSSLETNAPTVVLQRLDDIRFSYTEFADAVRRGQADRFLRLTAEQLERSGVSFGDTAKVIGFLKSESDALTEALERVNLTSGLLDPGSYTTAMDQISASIDAARTRLDLISAAGEGAFVAGEAAADAFKAKIEELNQQRIDGLKTKVGEAKTLLDEAGLAADAAKEKLRQFLAGENIETSLQTQIDEATIAIGGIGDAIVGLGGDLTSAVGSAEFRLKLSEAQAEAAGILTAAKPKPEDAAALLEPLIAAARESGAGDALVEGINAALAAYTSEEGRTLFQDILDTEGFVAEAQAALDLAELNLEVGLSLPPDLFVGFSDEAVAAFEEAGRLSAQGYVDGFDTEEMKTAAREGAEEALAAARRALGIASPSTEFATLGKDSVQGFVNGVRGAIAFARASMTGFGRSMMEAFAAGIRAAAGQAATAARTAVREAMDAAAAQIGGRTPTGASRPSTVNVTTRAVTLSTPDNASRPADAMMVTTGQLRQLARDINSELRPNVSIDQTFTEPVDSRAVAADVAWRLT